MLPDRLARVFLELIRVNDELAARLVVRIRGQRAWSVVVVHHAS